MTISSYDPVNAHWSRRKLLKINKPLLLKGRKVFRGTTLIGFEAHLCKIQKHGCFVISAPCNGSPRLSLQERVQPKSSGENFNGQIHKNAFSPGHSLPEWFKSRLLFSVNAVTKVKLDLKPPYLLKYLLLDVII
jgi:hypothetical protein